MRRGIFGQVVHLVKRQTRISPTAICNCMQRYGASSLV
jgi:hypothetical protein